MELIKKFEAQAPEIVFEWNDQETEARGWVVINSLKGGAAGGGTRMRKGLTKEEVLSLAKTMEIKFAIAGPPIGGAKSGIDFDPTDPRKHEVLTRWYKAIKPLLKNYYGTGGDLNVDEKEEVIPITYGLGIEHPQEGVLVGHYAPDEATKAQKISNLQKGVVLPVTSEGIAPKIKSVLTVSDLITGYGVAEAVKHYYSVFRGSDLEGKRAIIQGWGNVGASAAYYLASYGVKIVGIIDRKGGVINPDGFDFLTIKEFFENKSQNSLVADDMMDYVQVNEKIWSIGAEIFVPAAASRLVAEHHLDHMLKAGLEVISSGANVPFADNEIFMGPIATKADSLVSVIPDFIANCGMARTFAYLMSDSAVVSDRAIFSDVSNRILWAIQKCFEINHSVYGITRSAYQLALASQKSFLS
ncbi:amino acid dehydrogenase [Thermaurantimonas aggregans]|uniref:Amino acid dehydrogenase n=1 Tax=Thermaurantimonas aggregans TaxID=2173829 RepID=A0A401XM01_9FLAO|nr:Glu/Leu/Phe/Val dehydrogenase dimerization domain-containing protein [Thermaurantimonas aggregans]MCX8149500.1 Glu/Leu/Phe/Val dehydrogenase [Thermaurantimonas aggregans]GCD78024.1 amino acid dehydrogenase [Thermaurantimonas aggregans]